MRIERRTCNAGNRDREQRADAIPLHARALQCQIDRLLAQLLGVLQPQPVRIAPSRQVLVAGERHDHVARFHADTLMEA